MSVKLIVIEGVDQGVEFDLSQGESFSLGRDPKSCQLIVSDLKVSRQHITIRRAGNKYFLKNLSKTNLVQVNNREITDEVELKNNQKIQLGQTTLEFSQKDSKKKDKSEDGKFDNLFDDLEDDQNPADLLTGDSKSKEPIKKEPESENQFDTIFQDLGGNDSLEDFSDQYLGSERFILKVLAGPNTGAEFALQKARSYVLGTDVSGADIIFNDLSVSRHHARLSITEDNQIVVEDLNSRNGVVIDGELKAGQQSLSVKNLVTMGTTTFVIVDRESDEKTIITPSSKPIIEEPEKEEKEEIQKEEVEPKSKYQIKESTFMLSTILVALILILGVSAVFLFRTSPVERPQKDYSRDIQAAIGDEFSAVKFSYNNNSGVLFLVGHVLTTVDKEELLYKLSDLQYVSQVDDNVVTDSLVYEEMNQILSRNSSWRGISIYSPTPGRFVMTGYLPTRDDGALLSDFVNVQFPYVDRLINYVVIEQDLSQDIMSKLHNYGFYNVGVGLSNGEVTFSGYVNSAYEKAFEKVLKEICRINGVRTINNYVVIVGKATGSRNSEDPSVINITQYPGSDLSGTYKVTGYAVQGCEGRAVEINSSIYTVGDSLDGMKIISISDNTVYLESNYLKYKIEFNR